MASSLLCSQDSAFGPVSQCRSFDFTLQFSSAILSILPSCLFLLMMVPAIVKLAPRQRVMQPFTYLPRNGKWLICSKMSMAAIAAIADLVALAAWSISKGPSYPAYATTVSSLVLRIVSSILTLPMLWLEFFRCLHGSPILPLFFTIVSLCDASRVRTFALLNLGYTGESSSGSLLFFATFTIGFSARIILWFLETAPKYAFVERAEGDKGITHEETSSFFAHLMITSVNPVMLRGFRTDLTIQSLGPIHSMYDADHLYEKGAPHWERHCASGKSRPLLRTMFSAFGETLLAPILPCIICSLALITQPTLISSVIKFVESYSTGNPADRQPVANGWGLVGAYALVFIISTLAWSSFQMSALRSAVAMRGFLVQMIYKKALRIHADVAKEVGTGASTSLMSVDVERMMLQIEPLHLLYASLIMVAVGLIILYYTIGIAFVSTIIVAIAFFLSLPFLTRRIPSYQKSWSAQTDLRVRLVNSVIRSIKAVKLSGYEKVLVQKILTIRESEMACMITYFISLVVVAALTNWLKGLLSLATLITYTIISLHSDTAQVSTATFFTTIAVLGVITDPLLVVGQRYAAIMAASASLARIQEFLQMPERKDDRVNAETIKAENLALGHESITILQKMTFEVPKDALTMIVGQVGAGKSTLLHGLLGEVNILQGTLAFPKHVSVGFCSQDAWLRPGDSVRQNITFISPFHPALYRVVVKACALDVDFRIWPEGDKQKAQGLSGGQRARIALARTIYSRPDILLLDDVFSALDKQTEEHIHTCLFGANGLLRGKSVIMVTNGLHRLRDAEHIVLLENGTVGQQGSFEQLSTSPGAVKDLLSVISADSEHRSSSKAQPNFTEDAASSYINSLAASVDEIEAEMAAEVSQKSPLIAFFTSGGVSYFVLASVLMAAMSALPGVIPVYIQAWTTAVQADQGRMLTYLGGYIAIEIGYILLFCLALVYWYLVYSKNMSRRLHRQEVISIMNTPLSYFEDKPIGRILSRFSQDVFVMDSQVGNSWNNFFGLGVEMIVNIIVLTIAAPYVGIVLGVTVALCILVQRFYVRTSRQVRRMDFIAKSPLYTLFAETMDANGVKTIRAVRAQEELSKLAVAKSNTSQVPYYLTNALKKWLNLVLGAIVTIINCMLVTIAVINRESTSSGILAVALVQATSLVQTLNQTIVNAADFETSLVSISRIQETIELPSEEDNDQNGAQYEDPVEMGKIDLLEDMKMDSMKTAANWITSGSIRFQAVTLRYRPDLPPALDEVTFRVQGGRKVGIVGRSGCGKSTCLSALFRMMEIASGGIYIDGVDIRSLSRQALREAMTIIPQDPLMLELSVRDNLDIEGVKSDQEIWTALEQTQTKALIESLPEKLDTMVTGDGGNFSRGERQLLALARGLLRNRQILVLDEASSSLDVATDATMQTVLRSAFKGRTILAVAHRLNTLLDYDDIIVLSKGKVVEQGAPGQLLTNKNSTFSYMVRGELAADDAEVDDEAEIMEYLQSG